MAQSGRANRKVLVLPGDGIGPEIMREVMRVFDFFDRRNIARFDVGESLVGGAAYEASGTPLTDDTLAEAMASDAVLFGSVGGPKWETLPFELRPERGLLRLRKEMDLFANLRPAVVFDALADASALKRDLVAGLDLMIVRELTGGIYFGEPRWTRPMAWSRAGCGARSSSGCTPTTRKSSFPSCMPTIARCSSCATP